MDGLKVKQLFKASSLTWKRSFFRPSLPTPKKMPLKFGKIGKKGKNLTLALDSNLQHAGYWSSALTNLGTPYSHLKGRFLCYK